jgi:hypothetical protein
MGRWIGTMGRGSPCVFIERMERKGKEKRGQESGLLYIEHGMGYLQAKGRAICLA